MSAAVVAAGRYLAERGVASPREDAELLLMHVLGTDRAGLHTRGEGLDAEAAERFRRLLLRRGEGVPLQHLTGEQPFCGLPLRVRPGVFVPRPETETLVERALEVLGDVPGPRVVDVGTGTGAVGLAVKARRPDARVVATDASPAAVALARANARRLGLAIEVVEGDLLEPVPGAFLGLVDLVVSNPPYVTPGEYGELPPEVLADPADALLGGTEVHGRLADEARAWLRLGGWLVMEIGETQRAEVAGLMGARYDRVEVLPDLAGRDRVVRGRHGAG